MLRHAPLIVFAVLAACSNASPNPELDRAAAQIRARSDLSPDQKIEAIAALEQPRLEEKKAIKKYRENMTKLHETKKAVDASMCERYGTNCQ